MDYTHVDDSTKRDVTQGMLRAREIEHYQNELALLHCDELGLKADNPERKQIQENLKRLETAITVYHTELGKLGDAPDATP